MQLPTLSESDRDGQGANGKSLETAVDAAELLKGTIYTYTFPPCRTKAICSLMLIYGLLLLVSASEASYPSGESRKLPEAHFFDRCYGDLTTE